MKYAERLRQFCYIFLGILLLSSVSIDRMSGQAVAGPNTTKAAVSPEEAFNQELQKNVSIARGFIENSGMIDGLQAYLAAALNDESVCNKSTDPADSLGSMNFIILIKNIAEGKTDSITSLDMKNLALALKDNDDKDLSGYVLMLYNGLKDRDLSLISQAINEAEFTVNYGSQEPQDSLIFLNLYYGFLTRSAIPEVSYEGKGVDFDEILGYKILFNPQGPMFTYDSIVKDLVLLICAKEYNYPVEIAVKIIDMIRDPDIKEEALNPNIDGIRDLLQ